MADPQNASALRSWGRSHAYSLLSSLGRFARAPFHHALTLGVLALALALPTLAYLALQNLKSLSGALSQPGDVSLFLHPDLDAAVAESVQARVQLVAGVQSAELKTPEAALREFRALTVFTDALDVLGSNPLPFVVVVQLNRDTLRSERAMAVVEQLRGLPEVEIAQFDQEWLLRLKALMGLAERGVWVFGGLLALMVLLVVGNTIRLEIANRREEIQIVKLVGASDGFVRRPFLYSGFWFGAFGAGLAAILVAFSVHLLAPAVTELALSYASGFRLRGLSVREGLTLVLSGIALGWIGALLASASHLAESEAPE